MIIRELGMIVFGLLCGSILFGRALPKWIKGIDVTEVSNDHNPGTASAMKYAESRSGSCACWEIC